MKKTIILSALLTSMPSFGEITDSQYDARHLKVIEDAIYRECGNFLELKQVDSKKVDIIIDQGIRDAQYTTVINALKRFDQFRDPYVITVESQYIDTYDHSTRQWGAYDVSSVKCELAN